MIKTRTMQIAPQQDGDWMALGRNNVSKLKAPKGYEIDTVLGLIRCVDKKLWVGKITLVFDYFFPAKVSVQADKQQIAANGIEKLTLSIECEDDTLASVPIAVLEGDAEVGVIDVGLANGVGEHVMTISEAGTYTFQVDDVMSLDWSDVGEYRNDGKAVVEAI